MHNHNTAIYLNFKDFSSVFIWFFSNTKIAFSLTNTQLLKTQNIQGHPALIFDILAFFYIKNLSAKKSAKNFLELSRFLLREVGNQPIGAQLYIRVLNLPPPPLASFNLSSICPTLPPLLFYNLYVQNRLRKL